MNKNIFAEALACFNNYEYAQSYLLFLCLKEGNIECPALMFNLGLLSHLAENNEEALTYLNSALLLVKTISSQKFIGEMTNNYKKLRESDLVSDNYKTPITNDLPKLLPTYVKEKILRLTYDVSIALGNYEKAKTIVDVLKTKGYQFTI